jgi:outer membrane protein OmpA-like peptidoglycan-associated protein
MIKKITIITILIIAKMVTYGQLADSEYKKQYFEAEEFLDFEKYTEATNIFKNLVKEKPDNSNLNFKLGYCLLNSTFDKKEAISYLQKATSSVSIDYKYDNYSEKNTPIETYFYLGNALQFNYQFDEAIFNYNKFKEYVSNDDIDLNKKVAKRIEECNTGNILIQYPVEMNVQNLESNVNSEFDDHSPIFSADEKTLIYTSKRKSETNNVINDDGQYWENIYICTKTKDDNWSMPSPISSNINENRNIASISLSVDGQEAYLYRDDKGDGNIYVSKLNGDEWSVPEKLPEKINSKAKESHASISAESSTLYFSSNRKGGFGGSDIYMVKKLPNGEWGEPINLGIEINTEYDEESPFIHPDGVTLFFSSKGHKNIGGFDIFFTMNEGEGWMEATNIGYPINTTGDDVFYSPTPDGRRAYYSSKQKDGFGGSDLYLISLPNNVEKALTVYSGEVLLSDGKVPDNVLITVSDLKTQEEVGTYTPNSKTGKFLFILQPGKSYNILVEADDDLSYTETIDVTDNQTYKKLEKAIILDPIIFGGLSGSYYITFDKNKAKINKVSENELNNIAGFLQKNPKIIVGIKPLTDQENQIYKKRLNLISDSLSNKGISENRIKGISEVKAGEKSINIIIKEYNEETDGKQDVILADNNSEDTKNDNVNLNNGNLDNNNEDTKNDNSNHNGNSDNNDDVIKVNDRYIVSYILFDFDKYETNNYQDNIEKLSKYLKENKDAKIEIYAYADSQGSYEYNLYLTKKRAEFVKNKLMNLGVSKNQIQIFAKSNTEFVSKNLNPESRKYNRRVDFKIVNAGKSKIEIEKVKVPKKYKL